MIEGEKLRKEWDVSYYDDIDRCWVNKSKFQLEKFTPKIKKHFENGGLMRNTILAAICGVTEASIRNWLNPNHKNYQPEFHACIDLYRNKAAKFTDDLHIKVAAGVIDGNDRALNRRAEHILGLDEAKYRTKDLKKLKDAKTAIEQSQAIIEALSEQKITADEAKTLMQMVRYGVTIEQESELKPMLEELQAKFTAIEKKE